MRIELVIFVTSLAMLQLEWECYSIVELETSWEKEICIYVELGNFIFFPILFGIVLFLNR